MGRLYMVGKCGHRMEQVVALGASKNGLVLIRLLSRKRKLLSLTKYFRYLIFLPSRPFPEIMDL